MPCMTQRRMVLSGAAGIPACKYSRCNATLQWCASEVVLVQSSDKGILVAQRRVKWATRRNLSSHVTNSPTVNMTWTQLWVNFRSVPMSYSMRFAVKRVTQTLNERVSWGTFLHFVKLANSIRVKNRLGCVLSRRHLGRSYAIADLRRVWRRPLRFNSFSCLSYSHIRVVRWFTDLVVDA